jgi:ribosomal-protein-alanine N-acetyltransferase
VALSRIKLRSYLPSDFETLYRIDQICFPQGIAYGRFEMKVYLRVRGSYCMLAESDGEIAGFILCELAPDEGHIITLDVLEQYRRQAVGSMLLEDAEREAASMGGKRMVLETATTNKAAIAFWEKHGYRQFVTIDNYYGQGLDAFGMEKTLSPMPEER